MKKDKDIIDILCAATPESRCEQRLIKLAQLTRKTIKYKKMTAEIKPTVFKVTGNSMVDGKSHSLYPDDWLVCSKVSINDELPVKVNVFVIVSTRGNFVRAVKVDRRKKHIVCHAHNPDYKDFKIPFEEIEQLFIVDWMQRKRKLQF